MPGLSKLDLKEFTENHVLESSNLENSKIFRLSLEVIFLRTLDNYTKKRTHPRQFFMGEGVHAKVP